MFLSISNLKIHLGQKDILNQLSISFRLNGHITGLLGPNGAGKSTLFKCITGFERGYHGKIFLDKKDLSPLTPSKRTQEGIGYLPQESWLFQDMSVYQNLLIYCELLNQNRNVSSHELENSLNKMSISHLKDEKALNLSGGEKRRLEFSRILLYKPTILLLDEPFAGVDPKTISEISEIVKDLANQGISIVISDHHAEKIFHLADEVTVMHQGNLIETGSVDKILKSKEVKDIYLGTL